MVDGFLCWMLLERRKFHYDGHKNTVHSPAIVEVVISMFSRDIVNVGSGLGIALRWDAVITFYVTRPKGGIKTMDRA